MSFTDFRVPRKEFISSSEERKNDILIVKENSFDNDQVDLKSHDFKKSILYFQISSFKRCEIICILNVLISVCKTV